MLQEYIKGPTHNKWRKQVEEGQRSNKEAWWDWNNESRHEQEMKSIHEQMNQIMSMIQQNPQLAYIKPEVLTKKTIE